VTVKDG